MEIYTRYTTENIAHLVKESEGINSENTAGRYTVMVAAKADKTRQQAREDNTLGVAPSTTQTLAEVQMARKEKRKSTSGPQSQKLRCMASLATVVKLWNVASHAINMVLKNLRKRVVNKAKKASIVKIETFDLGCNKKFVRQEFQIAEQKVLTFVLQDHTEVYEVFRAEMVQVVRARNSAKEVENMLISNPAMLALNGTLAPKMINYAACSASEPNESAVHPSPLLSEYQSFSSKGK